MSNEYQIRKRGETCAKSGVPFSDGAAIVSRLSFGEEGYLRDDFAADAWTEDLRAGSISVWHGVFRVPPPPGKEPLKKETAESLLRDLMAKEDFSQKNAMYILAVMLERKRILVERDVQRREDGTLIRVYEHRKSGESFVIPDPGLKLAELQHVQEEVLELLGVKPPNAETDTGSEEEEAVEEASANG